MLRFPALAALPLCLVLSEARAQPVSVGVDSVSAADGDTVSVAIGMANPLAVSGLSLTMTFDTQVVHPVDVSTTPRTEGMEISHHSSDDSLRVLVIDSASGESITAGEGPIANVRFRVLDGAPDGVYRLGLSGVTAADSARPPTRLDVACVDGTLEVTGFVATLRASEGAPGDTVDVAVDLHNPDPVLGFQMRVRWESPDLEFVAVTAGARAGELRLFGASSVPGEATLVLADLSGASPLDPGEGPIAHLWLRVGPRALASTVQLGVVQVAASDPEGDAISVVARGALLDITEKVNVPPQLSLSEPITAMKPRPNVVIDEILADPPAGASGDANGDGTRDGRQDEFVEILNEGDTPVDISGWTLSDGDTTGPARFAFPAGTVLGPGERAVLFGGGRPVGIPGAVYTDDGTIGNGLTNAGDVVLLVDPAYADTLAIASYTFAGRAAGSLVPGGKGSYVPHSVFPGRGPHSPGRPRPTVSRLVLSAPDTIRVHTTVKVRVSALYTDLAVGDVTGEVEWHPDGGGLGTSDDGEITGAREGSTTLRATWNGLGASKTIQVTASSNAAPVVEAVATFSAPEDVPLEIRLLASDPDGDTLTFRLADGPSWLALGVDAVLRGVPGDSDVGHRRAAVVVSDGNADVDLSVEFEVVNRPPEITGTPGLRARVGALYRYGPEILNLDGGLVGLQAPVEGAQVDAATGSLRWRPTSAGEVTLALAAVDPNGGVARQSFVVVAEPRPLVAIDEILADPPSGSEGDANGDGTRDGKQDEFVELLNQGEGPVDIGGWTLSDDDVSAAGRFTFPAGAVLEPGKRVVLFGGGNPRGVPGAVYTDDGSIGNGLSNTGDTVLLIDPGLEDTLATAVFSWATDPGQSLVRIGDGWERHSDGNGVGLFSPGQARQVAADAASIPGSGTVPGDAEPIPGAPDSTSERPRGQPDQEQTSSGPADLPWGVVISEIHADPAPGEAGDANDDGIRHGYEDEFVELWNSSVTPADLGGCRLGDDDLRFSRLYQFPLGVVLPPGGHLTLFGGGQPQGIPGECVVDDGRIGDGLANDGDRVLLLSPDGTDTLASAAYPAGGEGVSWWAHEGRLIPHNRLPGRDLHSPGRRTPELVSIRLEPDSLILTPGGSGELRVTGSFSDGFQADLTDRVDCIPSDSSVTRVDRPGVVQALKAGFAVLLSQWEHLVATSWVRVEITGEPAAGEIDPAAPGEARDSAPADTTRGGGTGGSVVADTSKTPLGLDEGPVEATLEIYACPDSLARVGGLYSCVVEVRGSQADSATLRVEGAPGWLRLSRNVLAGVPLPGDVGTPEARLVASCSSRTVEISFPIRVVGNESHPWPDSLAHVGLTWRWPFRVEPGVEAEIRGGPEAATDGSGFVWRPAEADGGRHTVTLYVSVEGERVNVRDYTIVVLPRPRIEVTEILMDPPSDANGDGRTDALGDQFIELCNKGSFPVNLTGWTLGDDDRTPFVFPERAVMAPGTRFTLFGSCGDTAEGRFSAGGKIGNGLAGADRILLIHPVGPDTLVDVAYRGGRVAGSLIPDPAGTTAWIPHAAIYGEAFSPGHVREPAEPSNGAQDTIRAGEPEPGEDRMDQGLEGKPDLILHPPRPNPFNSSTVIGFETDGGQTTLVVYNTLGQPVRRLLDREMPNGSHRVAWHGRDERGLMVGSGVYLIVCQTETQTRTVRAVLLR